MDNPDLHRRVGVPAERLPGWLERFAERHGHPIPLPHPLGCHLTCPDGAEAVLVNRWAPLPDPTDLPSVVHHLTRHRRLALLLARKGAHAVGVADGPQLVESKVETHYVQGRTKAGGWSQQRYARRRDNQSAKAWHRAADDVATMLLPKLESLEAVVCGGDHTSVREVLADPRLEPLRPLVVEGVLPAPEPRLVVLEKFVDEARAPLVLLNQHA